jgi:hypothetical protein
VLDKLKSDPVHWGDPEYHTAHPGGIVCHGICNPLFVRYVVYTREQSVVILKLSLITGPTRPVI